MFPTTGLFPLPDMAGAPPMNEMDQYVARVIMSAPPSCVLSNVVRTPKGKASVLVGSSAAMVKVRTEVQKSALDKGDKALIVRLATLKEADVKAEVEVLSLTKESRGLTRVRARKAHTKARTAYAAAVKALPTSHLRVGSRSGPGPPPRGKQTKNKTQKQNTKTKHKNKTKQK
jgi:hypothetical protein